ncbi:NucA/NucB deoxyribonuclease domain-containing protein [Amycolatopsis japonica]|uniref:NucA/NucB deoxyribonuclease domain-containing protein n=1 Tax=Amycolatopsis japonica TaxID=208439 RepID=UPI0038108535
MAALVGTIVLGAPEAGVAQPASTAGSQVRVVITGLDGKPLQPGETYPVTAEGRFAAAAAKGNEPSREQASPEFQAATAALANRSVDKPMVAQEIPQYLLELCKKDARAETATGHVFHRLFWCQRYGLKAKAYRGTTLSGEVTLKWIAVAVGNYKIRTNTFMLQPTFAGDNWGDFGNVVTTQLMAGPICGSAGDPGCSVNTRPVTMSVADWQREVNIQSWYGWRIESDETKSTAVDKVSNHTWRITTGVHTPEPGREWTADTPDNGMRCDSATYFRYDPKSCISSDVIPWLPVFAGLLPEYAAHISQALNAPDTTFPPEPHPKLIPGKYVYGNSTVPGLHRLPDAEKKPNSDEKDRACARIPTPHDPDEQCDEYPFAATVEGAASPVWDFSVKYIDGWQNGQGGNALQALYQSSRILYKDLDKFYVNVIN